MSQESRSRKAQVWIACRRGEKIRVLLFRLLLERGGFWQPVTGGVETGETYLEGAVRELREESGFDVRPGALIDLRYSFRFTGRYGDVEEFVFLYPLLEERDPTLDGKEHSRFEWVDEDEARRRITFPNQLHALDLIRKHFLSES